MSSTPITDAIEQTVDRLQKNDKDSASLLAELERVGVVVDLTEEGVFWRFSFGTGLE